MAATRSLFFIEETPERPISWAIFFSSGRSIVDSPPPERPVRGFGSVSAATLIVSVTWFLCVNGRVRGLVLHHAPSASLVDWTQLGRAGAQGMTGDPVGYPGYPPHRSE